MQMFIVNRQETIIDRLDPRVRIIWMVLVSTIVIRFHTLEPIGIVILSQVLVWILARRVRVMLRACLGIGAFMIFVAALQFLVGLMGTTWQEALYKATVDAFRYFVMASAAVVLFQTTDGTEIGAAIRTLKLPKAPAFWNTTVEGLAFALSFGYQLIPLIVREIAGVAEVQRARGVGVREGTRVQQVRKLLSMTAPLFTRTLDLVRSGSLAMLNYGYSPIRSRSSYIRLRLRSPDWAALTLMLAGTVAAYIL